jgi:hypothetical protein
MASTTTTTTNNHQSTSTTTTSTRDWSKVDKEQILPLARELRASTATRSAVFNSASVSYIKGGKFIEHLIANDVRKREEAIEIGTAFIRLGFIIKTDIADRNKRMYV